MPRSPVEYGTLHTDGYAGRSAQRVVIVRRTPKRVLIRAVGFTKLAGRNRWLLAGEEALVPSKAVTPEVPHAP